MSTTTKATWTYTLECDAADASTPEQIIAAKEAAELTLWGATGRRLGQNATVGEEFRVTACESTGMPVPYLLEGVWNQTACRSGGVRLILRNGPVRTITEVRVGGVATADYSYSGGVVTLTAAACPVCEVYGDDPSIEVDYVWGVWPTGVAGALSELACEYLVGLTGGTCRLSARAVSIARQGVQIEMENASELLESGMTGLPVTDAFIRAMNPNRLMQRSRVLSPDTPSAVG